MKTWSGQRDSNSRPSGPKPDALPGCAMPRIYVYMHWYSAQKTINQQKNEKLPNNYKTT